MCSGEEITLREKQKKKNNTPSTKTIAINVSVNSSAEGKPEI